MTTIPEHFHFTAFLFLLVCIVFAPISANSTEMVSIKGDKVILREEPDSQSRPLWELGNGYPLEILKKKGDWIFIRDFEKTTGWLPKTKVSKTHYVVVKANRNEEQSINIRKDPTLDSTIVGNAFYGVVFSILQKKGGWVQVQHETGVTGWTKSDFLWGL